MRRQSSAAMVDRSPVVSSPSSSELSSSEEEDAARRSRKGSNASFAGRQGRLSSFLGGASRHREQLHQQQQQEILYQQQMQYQIMQQQEQMKQFQQFQRVQAAAAAANMESGTGNASKGMAFVDRPVPSSLTSDIGPLPLFSDMNHGSTGALSFGAPHPVSGQSFGGIPPYHFPPSASSRHAGSVRSSSARSKAHSKGRSRSRSRRRGGSNSQSDATMPPAMEDIERPMLPSLVSDTGSTSAGILGGGSHAAAAARAVPYSSGHGQGRHMGDRGGGHVVGGGGGVPFSSAHSNSGGVPYSSGHRQPASIAAVAGRRGTPARLAYRRSHSSGFGDNDAHSGDTGTGDMPVQPSAATEGLRSGDGNRGSDATMSGSSAILAAESLSTPSMSVGGAAFEGTNKPDHHAE